MSGFSPEWLRLREPADHRARDRGLAKRLAAYLEGRETVRLIDLGCGTGSNLRALAPALPGKQHWRLVDYDPRLLDAAREEIGAWSSRMGCRPDVAYETADLRTDMGGLIAQDCDIVTASALFDLMSPDWLDRFAVLLAERRCALYTVLIYDGAMDWQPAHPADEAIRIAFNAHQRTDKGFGPAAGPDAGGHLVKALTRAGFRVFEAPSPWILTDEDRPLIAATAEGVAGAALEAGDVSPADASGWLASRAMLQRCTIGHMDILALPQA